MVDAARRTSRAGKSLWRVRLYRSLMLRSCGPLITLTPFPPIGHTSGPNSRRGHRTASALFHTRAKDGVRRGKETKTRGDRIGRGSRRYGVARKQQRRGGADDDKRRGEERDQYWECFRNLDSGDVTVTRRETGEMGTEWNGSARPYYSLTSWAHLFS